MKQTQEKTAHELLAELLVEMRDTIGSTTAGLTSIDQSVCWMVRADDLFNIRALLDEIQAAYWLLNPPKTLEVDVSTDDPINYWDDAIAFAIRTKQAGALRKALSLCELPNRSLTLYRDSAPYSFGFTLYACGESGSIHEVKRLFSGGIIYHGPLENGTYPETFSVTLSNQEGWQVHT